MVLQKCYLPPGSWALIILDVSLTSAVHLLLTPPSAAVLAGQTVQFSCTLKEGHCENVIFFWRQTHLFPNGSESSKSDITEGGRFSISNRPLGSSLTIKPVKPRDCGNFTCSALCVKIKKVSLWATSHLEVKAVPKLILISQAANEDPNVLNLTCAAVGFYPPNVSISWHHSLPVSPHPIQQGDPTLLQGDTYSSKSILQVSATLWTFGEEIGCEVGHSSLKQPMKESIRKGVMVLLSSAPDVNGVITLTCVAVGFHPPDITLIWDHSLVGMIHTTQQGASPPHQDSIYTSSSTLQVSTSQWSQGEEITCVGNHSSLSQPLRERIRREGSISFSRLKWCHLKMGLLSVGLVLMILSVTAAHMKITKRRNLDA